VLGAGRARAWSVLFNEDEVKHAGQKQQQQQSKKHTHKEQLIAIVNCNSAGQPENEVDVICDAR